MAKKQRRWRFAASGPPDVTVTGPSHAIEIAAVGLREIGAIKLLSAFAYSRNNYSNNTNGGPKAREHLKSRYGTVASQMN